MSYPAPGVRQVSAVEPVRDRSPQERVIVGEVLDRQLASDKRSTESHFTFDGQKESHPGFYQKYEPLANKHQRAIDLYHNTAELQQSTVDNGTERIDYFV